MSKLIRRFNFYSRDMLLFALMIIVTAITGVSCLLLAVSTNPNTKGYQFANSKNSLIDDFRSKQKEGTVVTGSLKGIPVLIYHYISDDPKEKSDTVMPVAKFRAQMKYLKDNHFTTISLDDLEANFSKGTPLTNKPVVLTFDDGDESLYQNAYPILKKYNLRATFFVITNFTDKHSNCLTSEQLIDLQNNGIDIESHTQNHEVLDILTYDQQYSTLQESKLYLEKLLNKKVKYIAYPRGAYNQDTIKALKDIGYEMAFTGIRGLADRSNSLYELHRIYIGRGDSQRLFKRVLVGNFL